MLYGDEARGTPVALAADAAEFEEFLSSAPISMKGEASSPRAITLRDVADAVGVSHVTVSAALRNSPRISEPRRRQIQQVAREMGYRPNAMATALAHFKKASSVTPVQAALAWLNLWPQPEKLRGHREFDFYWQGALAAAEKLGFHLEEFSSGKQLSLARIEEILIARGISGILLPPLPTPPNWGAFNWRRFATVRFGRSLDSPQAHVVTADQLANAVLATDEIAARGYQRIGFVAGHPNHNRRRLFDAGFLSAQQDMEESRRLPICWMDDMNPKGSGKLLEKWLKREKPDAILGDSAILARLLKEIGVRVPEDVGMAVTSVLDGGGDAGIDQEPMEIGRVAVLVLVSLVHDNDYGVPPIYREILIKGKWVDGSCLPRISAPVKKSRT